MPGHPIAFVDESWLQQRGSPGAYLTAAVLIESDDIGPAITAANTAAAGQPYHSSELYHRGHVGTIEAMLDVVADHAGWSVVSAQVPLHDNTTPDNPRHIRGHLEDQRERARQISLERLLRYLNTQRVRDVYLESRASLAEWQQARDSGTRLPATDRHDIRAYRRLLDQGAISHRMRLIHIKDRSHAGLWMADAVAWSAGRAIRADEPQWWNRIADVATVLEAETGAELRLNERGAAPPAGERDPHNLSQSAQAMFSPSFYTATGEHSHPGAILTSLLHQADRARGAPLDPVTREVLTYVRQIADRVDKLTETVNRIVPSPRAEPEPSPSPDTSQPAPNASDAPQPQPGTDID